MPRVDPELVEGSIVASVNIKPLEDKILVQANEAETTTASGLVIPDTAKVIYSKYGGTEIKYNNEEYLILSARDVLAIVNK